MEELPGPKANLTFFLFIKSDSTHVFEYEETF